MANFYNILEKTSGLLSCPYYTEPHRILKPYIKSQNKSEINKN